MRLIASFNPSTYRLILYTLVIGGSFYLGALLYIPYFTDNTEIATVSLKKFRPQLEKIERKNLQIKADGQLITVQGQELKKWIEPYVRAYSGEEDLRLSFAQISKYLESLAPRLNTQPINAKLTFKDSRAQIFVPSSHGKNLNIQTSATILADAIIDNQTSANLVFDVVDPEITLEKINNLGINALLGGGESDYGKSSSARIHNIRIGLSKFNGIILKPGEEFSFNNWLGEVDEEAGYKSELVIKNGELVSEYGGGLCQVATTVFRAAILSGMEIEERKPHSFPVQYYNPQGFDATIYPGIVDLKFINSTSNHILIQTKLIGSKLLVEIYGTSGGKEIVIDGPYQYDQTPSGAMKAYFTRKIYKDDQLVEEERFNSVYNPPPPHPLERNPLE
ncbi:MAG: hypothetical protein A3B91_05220 [Candidatus Yanofskybacteria bacterium RIFCSPHIGHO2_02_FULL_41_29]|uniref:YoaR-like putative peptidoglycan binding domain-containing protein n=1 Tax=Candidatus Yanofskybacteria bacterium RIFCSPHIGHO2_01_FULL_41_53 TaxID=1802663 RepID=A0A1F8EL03_9BACT|nr:MAG: hypothetical protein A2650_03940 [Candidatus Yanofskybacteria bacterium RIFCSPHIGHO2_01_FULL_41_53]OGN11690.1 MAG: hypothetical protein A3B91_05220 [Candidatus Yanofskybacteria bacterium RIFCSPHIGHO2_02_FULL_41_29]OGN19185.1 MAG: hypothetical protein A3F48_02985 [Candidatus Yanofskybacteria bacterium RIFCSPHIGHO2_12_FULL_41_9]OGN24445.1 MAG: hypothetical protein A2916_00420 [Candidatus Yanofskybacteria bacterium RIFCSPLOWO2_01_FULL_41_67]OGN30327.1 MAG: hypothetical protein A3H54_04600 